MGAKSKKAASWSSVKSGLRDFDRTALLGLLQDLYAAGKDNQAFLHARLNLGGDPLAPYNTIISRFICPDVFKNQPISVAKEKKAVSDYKKAIGYPEGMAELTTFYCEEVLAIPEFLLDGGRGLLLGAPPHVRAGAEVGDGPPRSPAGTVSQTLGSRPCRRAEDRLGRWR